MAVLHQDPTELRKKEPSIPIDLEVITHRSAQRTDSARYDSRGRSPMIQTVSARGLILRAPATTLYRLRVEWPHVIAAPLLL